MGRFIKMNVIEHRKIALVTTTIHIPYCLENYLANAERNGHLDRTSVIVVGDRKTPPSIRDYLIKLGRCFPSPINYLDIEAQGPFLRRWPGLDQALRYNCIQRRNIGYLQAALEGADVII